MDVASQNDTRTNPCRRASSQEYIKFSIFRRRPGSRPISSSFSSRHLQNSATLFWCLAQCDALRCLHCAVTTHSTPLQVHSYFGLCKSDTWIRYLIYYLILMETINTICDIGVIYEPLIILHGAPTLPPLPFANLLATDPIVTTLISTPTQLFMAWRIRLVTKSKWPAGLVVFLIFTSLVPLGPGLPEVVTALAVWLTSTAFADLFITGFLVKFLWVNKTGFQTRTDSTGALTSFAAVADIVFFLIAPILNARTEWNILLAAGPSAEEKLTPNAIIRVREATDIEGLQLYVPSRFESSANLSPRKRMSHALFYSILLGLYECCCTKSLNLALVRFLLASGADPNLQSPQARIADEFNPLFTAVCTQNTAVARVLVDGGADIHSKEIGLALQGCKSIEVLRLFLERGADPDPDEYAGHTLLHNACLQENQCSRRLPSRPFFNSEWH
ncbi:hypothetical protein B0H14DRAFT_2835209 [Mycena olivaceomarginata]|nr:hypothetical protein B0H14DRAFT_2835209 [Mycena olivaceomarginata]